MKTLQSNQDAGSHTFLTGAILFANLDYSGLAGYAVKAVIGGAIWMGFKLAGDYLAHRMASRARRKDQEEQSSNPEND